MLNKTIFTKVSGTAEDREIYFLCGNSFQETEMGQCKKNCPSYYKCKHIMNAYDKLIMLEDGLFTVEQMNKVLE